MIKEQVVFISKPLFFVFLFAIIGLSLLYLGHEKAEVDEPKIYNLHYCPTMSKYAMIIDQKNINLVESGSSAQAMSDLRTGRADIVLIGRRAYSHEMLDGLNEMIAKQGYTLVSSSKRFIDISNIPQLEVHTHHDEAVVKNLIFSDNVIYHNNMDEAIESMEDGAVLISWEEYVNDGRYDLLIPMKGNAKAEEFRTPVVYFKDANINLIDQIKTKIGDEYV